MVIQIFTIIQTVKIRIHLFIVSFLLLFKSTNVEVLKYMLFKKVTFFIREVYNVNLPIFVNQANLKKNVESWLSLKARVCVNVVGRGP